MTQLEADIIRPYLTEPIIVIDVGCHKGHFVDDFTHHFKAEFSIGIDPVNHNVGSKYNKYYEVAISDKGGESKLFTYVEPECNSLLEMKTKNVVHNKEKAGWFVAHQIEDKMEEYTVKVVRLESLLEENSLIKIDYLKIDTQGNDIKVVKSCGKFLKDIKLIQMECVSSHDKNIVLYDGQQLMEQDIEDMDKLGFDVLNITDYSENASPEADIIFINRNIK